jgi:two-component system chemotaxis sensor kinase CheA
VLANFEELELRNTEQTIQKTVSIVETVVEEFQLRGLDWSDWDDLAAYLEKPTPEWEEANLTNDVLSSVNWETLVILREGGQRVFGARYNPDGDSTLPVHPDFERLIADGTLVKPGLVVSGIARIGDELQFVASRPILRTDHSPGPVRGFMLSSRRVDEAQINRLQKFTFLEVDFRPLWKPIQTPQGKVAREELGRGKPLALVDAGDSIYAYSRVKDVRGAPLFDVRVIRPKVLNPPALQLLAALTKALLGASLLLAVLAVLGMSGGVLRPLAMVLGGVRKLQHGERVQVTVASQDEIGELAQAFNQMAKSIFEREDALKLVLDSTGDGLVLMSPSGELRGQASAPALRWFGEPKGTLGDWLPLDERSRTNLELGLEQLVDDFMPFEVTVAMLPREFTFVERIYRVRYQEVRQGERLTDVLLIISDATDIVAAERSESEARELQAIGRAAIRDRAAVASFLSEADAIVEYLGEPNELADVKRAIHTLKGNTAIFGLESVAECCHEVETLLTEDEAEGRSAVPRVRMAWKAARARIESVFGASGANTIELDEREYEQFLERLVATRVDHHLVHQVKAWRNMPTKAVLERLGAQVKRLSEKLEKDIEIDVIDDGNRLPDAAMGGFIASLIHVVRNAVDHGIETSYERVERGKPRNGKIVLSAHQTSEWFVVEVKDDGRGIDWAKIGEKAAGMNLPYETRSDLERALFAEGISTAAEITDISGRGVGMGAVEFACRDAGGHISIETAEGVGTTFRFLFPLRAKSAAA